MMIRPETTILDKITNFTKQDIPRNQYLVKDDRIGSNSVSLLIVGEDFLLEAKNSVVFGNAVS